MLTIYWKYNVGTVMATGLKINCQCLVTTRASIPEFLVAQAKIKWPSNFLY